MSEEQPLERTRSIPESEGHYKQRAFEKKEAVKPTENSDDLQSNMYEQPKLKEGDNTQRSAKSSDVSSSSHEITSPGKHKKKRIISESGGNYKQKTLENKDAAKPIENSDDLRLYMYEQSELKEEDNTQYSASSDPTSTPLKNNSPRKHKRKRIMSKNGGDYKQKALENKDAAKPIENSDDLQSNISEQPELKEEDNTQYSASSDLTSTPHKSNSPRKHKRKRIMSESEGNYKQKALENKDAAKPIENSDDLQSNISEQPELKEEDNTQYSAKSSDPTSSPHKNDSPRKRKRKRIISKSDYKQKTFENKDVAKPIEKSDDLEPNISEQSELKEEDDNTQYSAKSSEPTSTSHKNNSSGKHKRKRILFEIEGEYKQKTLENKDAAKPFENSDDLESNISEQPELKEEDDNTQYSAKSSDLTSTPHKNNSPGKHKRKRIISEIESDYKQKTFEKDDAAKPIENSDDLQSNISEQSELKEEDNTELGAKSSDATSSPQKNSSLGKRKKRRIMAESEGNYKQKTFENKDVTKPIENSDDLQSNINEQSELREEDDNTQYSASSDLTSTPHKNNSSWKHKRKRIMSEIESGYKRKTFEKDDTAKPIENSDDLQSNISEQPELKKEDNTELSAKSSDTTLSPQKNSSLGKRKRKRIMSESESNYKQKTFENKDVTKPIGNSDDLQSNISEQSELREEDDNTQYSASSDLTSTSHKNNSSRKHKRKRIISEIESDYKQKTFEKDDTAKPIENSDDLQSNISEQPELKKEDNTQYSAKSSDSTSSPHKNNSPGKHRKKRRNIEEGSGLPGNFNTCGQLNETHESNCSDSDEVEIRRKNKYYDLLAEIDEEDAFLEQSKEKLKTLKIQLAFFVSESHLIETHLAHPPEREERELLEQLNVQVEYKKFSPEEDAVIHKNWKKFSQVYQFTDVRPFLLLNNLKASQRRHFVRYLGHGLPNRYTLQHICKISSSVQVLQEREVSDVNPVKKFQKLVLLYFGIVTFVAHVTLHKFKSNFGPSHFLVWNSLPVDRMFNIRKADVYFTEEEDEILLFHLSNGADEKTAFATISRLLRRERHAVFIRYRRLIANLPEQAESLKWDLDTCQMVVTALMKIIDIKKVKHLRDRHITSAEWELVGKECDVRPRRIKEFWKLKLSTMLFATKPVYLNKIRIAIIKRLYKSHVKWWQDIVWTDVAKDFDGIGSMFLWKVFRTLLKMCYPHKSWKDVYKDFRAIVKDLKKRHIPILRSKGDYRLMRLRMGQDGLLFALKDDENVESQ